MFVLGYLPQFVQSWGMGCVGWGRGAQQQPWSSGRVSSEDSTPLQGWRLSGAPPGDMVSAAEEYWGCEALWWVSSKQCSGISMSFKEIWVNRRELLRVGDSCWGFLGSFASVTAGGSVLSRHLWAHSGFSASSSSGEGGLASLFFLSGWAISSPVAQNPLCADHSQMHYLCCRLLKPDVLRWRTNLEQARRNILVIWFFKMLIPLSLYKMIIWLYFLKVEQVIKVQRMMPKEKQPQYSTPCHPWITSILSIWSLLYGWKKQIIFFVEKEEFYYI